MPAIETSRLYLRSCRKSDIPILHRLVFGDGEVMRWLFEGGAKSWEETKRFAAVSLSFDESEVGISTLVTKADDAVIGFAGMIPCAVLGADDLEFGFAIARSEWGKGYASEIGEAQLVYGFAVLGRQRMLALAHPENHASRRVLTKLGMRHVCSVTIERGAREVHVKCAGKRA